MSTALRTALILCCLAAAAAQSRIKLQKDARYVNMLVAISEEVPEDWSLVQRIKQAFQAASRSLALATQFHDSSLAFGDVRILIPGSWENATNLTDAAATWETQDAADFRVVNTGSTVPFTVQPGGCGDAGLFVNLHASHIASTEDRLMGKQLLHEFAHLRWGLFSEYNGPSGPHSYLENGRITPVACSKSIKGKFANIETGSPCRVDRVTLELEPDCRFVPDIMQSVRSSLMYATYLPDVTEFCTEGEDADTEHNSNAPNPHNRMCRGRSAKYVMTKHNDMIEAMGDLVRDRVTAKQKIVDVYSSSVLAGFSASVEIDESVARSASFALTSSRVSDIKNADLRITSPRGKVYDKSSDVYEKDAENGIIVVNLPGNIETRTWSVSDTGSVSSFSMASRDSSGMSLTVSSRASASSPIILDGRIGDNDGTLSADSRFVIYATLAQGTQLIRDAAITASVESDDRVEAQLLLMDNGVGADAHANDGVYTGLVPSSVQTKQEYNVRLLCTKPVSRVATAGKFEIKKVEGASLKSIPPARIQDLAARIDIADSSVNLTWTAVGNEDLIGAAPEYTVSVCSTAMALTNSTQLEGCMNITAAVPAKPAYEQLSVTLSGSQLGLPSSTVYIGVRAVSNTSVSGEMSNAASVQLKMAENIDEIGVSSATGVHAGASAAAMLALVAMVTRALH